MFVPVSGGPAIDDQQFILNGEPHGPIGTQTRELRWDSGYLRPFMPAPRVNQRQELPAA